ncbi:MAG: hypothetical protein IKV97_04750 [Clostridia bacterium]|nr:hypothetical protein [Clostridia bacterium]
MKKFLKKIFASPRRILCVCLCTLAVCCPVGVLAAEYLSENDPLITLSYLKEVFAPLLKEEIKMELNGAPAEEESVYVGYTVVELSKDQLLKSTFGTVELIVRPGSSAVVVSDIPENGLSDVSEAKEILNGEEVGINHVLIIPRNDGRGIRITSEKAYVLARGDYAVE